MKYAKVYVTVTARNVLFSKETEDFLKELQDKAANTNVKKYVKSNLRNWLVNSFEHVERVIRAKSSDPAWLKTALERGDEVYSLDLSPREMETISHWVDYLNTLNGDISRISIPQLQKKVKEWEESFAKQKAGNEDGIELIHKYSDGFSWVRVFGKDSLNREGKLMNHCVGSYYNEVKNNKTSIYSLRDKSNKPHCTIEIRKGKIEQIKGNSNKSIKQQYRKYIIDFLEKRYVKFNSANSSDLVDIGLLENGGKIYELRNLPENLKIDGDLRLFHTEIDSLPNGLEVTGVLHIIGTEMTSLPKRLKVGEKLILSDTKITSLPKDLKVNGNLNISFSDITSLPKGLKVGGDLDLSDTEIASLPEGLEVGGDLDISYTKILSLPPDLKVGGNIRSRDDDDDDYDDYDEEDEEEE